MGGGVERDYLFYGIPLKQSAAEGEGGAGAGAGGLCWLTFGSEDSSSKLEASLPKFFTAAPSHQILNVVRDNVVPFLNHEQLHSKKDRWLVIWNDQAGLKLAKLWLDNIILPLLNFAGIPSSQIQVYQSRQSGAGEPILEEEEEEDLQFKFDRCIILGGDGTVSDFLNQIYRSRRHNKNTTKGDDEKAKFDLIIIPLGTANAMFHAIHPRIKELTRPKDILSGLMTALLEPTRRADGVPEPSPPTLTLARVRIIGSDGKTIEELISFVVVSTSLHASILDTANQLVQQPEYRASGTQVFKQAFQQNAAKTWTARVELLPSKSNQSIERYDPTEDTLDGILISDDKTDTNNGGKNSGDDGVGLNLKLEGQFSYFTSCLIDRLESKFIIAPLRKPTHDSPATLESTLDLVIIRPTQQQQQQQQQQVDKNNPDSLVQLVGSVMQAAYQEGHHIKLFNTHDQTPIVEYYRCGGWIWKPIQVDQENNSHQVCIDGKVIQIPKDGSIECTILSKDEIEIQIH